MILPFSTQLNGKSTYFVEKILRGIEIYKAPINLLDFWKHTGYDLFSKQNVTPKFHTIREDKNDRWKAGTKIDFFINCRQKNMFRFAPVLPVVSVQKIEIAWYNKKPEWYKNVTVSVDGFSLNRTKIVELAQNDGFDSVEDFFRYFDKDFKGKIIHWTDLKY
jgi:hypothetical protein